MEKETKDESKQGEKSFPNPPKIMINEHYLSNMSNSNSRMVPRYGDYNADQSELNPILDRKKSKAFNDEQVLTVDESLRKRENTNVIGSERV